MKYFYVYELVNLMGGIEYVGSTLYPKKRFYKHIKIKSNGRSGSGKFYGRQDLIMNIVCSYDNKIEARQEEIRLQKIWGFETEDEKVSKAVRGEKNSISKLTEDQVKEILLMIKKSITNKDIAKKFNVTASTIYKIKNKRAWTHVK